MADTPHFMDPNGPMAAILDAILSTAGPNFEAPYQSSTQPHDMVGANHDALINYQLPAGAHVDGHADPGSGGGIGKAINSMLGFLSPAISAYALILPIMGVIRGIIEIICCLSNPFCLIPAIIRLFSKWLPPFISLFPAVAGVVIVLSTIKAILALVYHILIEVVPVVQLIIQNMLDLDDFLKQSDDLSQDRIDAVNAKLSSLLDTLIQKTGVLSVFMPLLELIFSILSLTSGLPCGSGDSDGAGGCGEDVGTGTLEGQKVPVTGSDSGLCDDACPEALSSRDAAPSGSGLVINSSYCDYAPSFVFLLKTGNEAVRELEQFQESKEAQLNGCMDEEITEARPAGSTGDRSNIKVKISNSRGASITVPALLISGTTVKFVSPLGALFAGGTVDYEIQPDYDMMVMSGVMGAGCHPDVQSVKRALATRYPQLPGSLTSNNPEVANLVGDTGDYNNSITNNQAKLRDAVNAGDVAGVEAIRDDIITDSNDFIASLTGMMNAVINRNVSASASGFLVSKNIVTADASDVSVITISPRDITGAPLVRNAPAGVEVNVEIDTDFGEVFGQTFNVNTGDFTASIRSATTGTANITARINQVTVTRFDATTEDDQVEEVRFISEAALPARRNREQQAAADKLSGD